MCPGEFCQCTGMFLCVVFLKKNLHRLNYFVCSVRLILVGLMSMTEQFVSCPKVISFIMMLQSIWDMRIFVCLKHELINKCRKSFIALYPGSPQFHVGSAVLPHSVVHLGPRAAHTLNTSLFFCRFLGYFSPGKCSGLAARAADQSWGATAAPSGSCSIPSLFRLHWDQKLWETQVSSKYFLVCKSSRNQFVEESGCRAAPAGVRAWLLQEGLEMCWIKWVALKLGVIKQKKEKKEKENFKQRNVQLPEKGWKWFRLPEVALGMKFEENEVLPCSSVAIKDVQPLADPSVMLFLKYCMLQLSGLFFFPAECTCH